MLLLPKGRGNETMAESAYMECFSLEERGRGHLSRKESGPAGGDMGRSRTVWST